MTATKQRRNQIAFIVILLVVVLCSCVLVGTLLAWLKDEEETSSSGELNLGSISFGVYNGSTAVTADQEIALSGSSNIRNVDIKVRNLGTTEGLIRVTMSMYYKDSSGNQIPFRIVASPSNSGEATFSALNWIYSMAGGTANADINLGGGVTSGYMYYNSKVLPYNVKRMVDNGDGTTSVVTQAVSANAISIVSQILLSSTQANETIYLKVSVDGVAHSGNIYKKLEAGETTADDIPVTAYPFGTPASLPAIWTAPYL